ncbi:hypothetical protein DL240_16640 [Lujinxingia litoralis]|uniref:Uncharacterized protein n=1 Tax=Lujinxingia litoralis TaxID=2211119 RepID=A0A328C544_9DELT|nr:efflux RND transporter periplasmic adaptor subunit [Lujinxingia litoralis]RAL20432.1 hypothetical protein DL240_16640 [Lujinxingia litoralis]
MTLTTSPIPPRRALAALALTLALVGCNSEAANMPAAEEVELPPTPVNAIELQATDFTDTFDVLGTAEPVDSVRLMAEVPGRILNAYVEEGEEVKRNQKIFRIDVELDAARIDLMNTQVDAADRELRRLQRLRAEGLATPQQIDQATTSLENARQNLRQARIGVSKNRVTSPLAGHLVNRNAEPGEFANPGLALAEVIVYDTIVVHAQVPESELRHLDKSATIEVHIPALDKSFEGTIHRVGLRPLGATSTYPVEIRVDNANLEIRPGMRASLRFERDHHEDVVMVPREAILEGYNARETMVVSADGTAELRQVEVGPGNATHIMVTRGLSPGDRLIVRGHRALVSGTHVKVVPDPHASAPSTDTNASKADAEAPKADTEAPAAEDKETL